MISIEYLRQFKIGPFAVFDLVAAYGGMLILSPVLRWFSSKLRLSIPTASWLWFTLPLSVVFHLMFHQSTPLMKALTNPRDVQFYLVFLVLLLMLYMGVRNMRRLS